MPEYFALSAKVVTKTRKKQKAEAQEENKRATSVQALKQKFLSQKVGKSAKKTLDRKVAATSVNDYVALPSTKK
uniref:Uncharacterized protein n=1 Tax=Hyaloperonospora arabidopsidis (strain Emoy2) TaxID=559515 RepID=M4BMI3_HYAAE